jgi:hypothetical protein
MGARAIASESGTRSVNPGMPLLSLPDQIVLQSRSLIAPNSDFPA